MARLKAGPGGAQGARRSARLIDKVNGTTGPRSTRAPDQPNTESFMKPSRGRKRSVPKQQPGQEKTDKARKQKTQQNASSRKAKESESKRRKPKDDEKEEKMLTASKKAKEPGTKSTLESKMRTRTRSKSQPGETRGKSRAKSSRSETQSEKPKRSTRAKGSEIREDVGEVKPGGLVSALGKVKTPWEVSDEEAHERRLRATSHRLFLVGRRDSAQNLAEDNLTYVVMGTTGNIYYATLSSNVVRCTCPDQRVRKVFCKHILFVLFKVLKIPETHPVAKRKFAEMTPDELDEIYQMSRHIQLDQRAMAPEGVRKAWQSATGQAPNLEDQDQAQAATQREIASDDDCPICFDSLDNGEPLEYCKGSCGRSVHAECFGKWAARKKKDNEPVTCVYCRQPWVGERTPEDRVIKRKRMNLEEYVGK